MTQMLKRPLPGITAAHLASFTTVPAAPELHSSGMSFRWRGEDTELGEVVRLRQWWRNPAIVMRGWGPREIETPAPWSQRIGAALAAVVARIKVWHERSRGRQMLLRMDDYALKDIGLDRASAQAEAELPFWREHR